MGEILCGIDWASDHHDVALIDPAGSKLGRLRIGDTAAGLGELTGMFAAHGGGPGMVKIAIETERGLLVASLRAAGYEIYPVNPKAVDRYRDRHRLARSKSDAADALVLAHILRTDAHLHRPLPADSTTARAIEVLARAHQDLVWGRQHEVNGCARCWACTIRQRWQPSGIWPPAPRSRCWPPPPHPRQRPG